MRDSSRYVPVLAALACLLPVGDTQAAGQLRVFVSDRVVRAGSLVTVGVSPTQPGCTLLVRAGGQRGPITARQRVRRNGRLRLAARLPGRRTVEVRCGRRKGYVTFRIREANRNDRRALDGELDDGAIPPRFERAGSDEGGGAPDLQIPFPCSERWRSSTYAGHGRALDWNDPSRDDGGRPAVASGAGTALLGPSGGWNGGYGNYVIVNHGGGWTTMYGHLRGYAVSHGAAVARGQVIGYVGTTGNSTGNHLHYEQRLNRVKQPLISLAVGWPRA
jgi:hypothetical protein